jgi:hypothetical protein
MVFDLCNVSVSVKQIKFFYAHVIEIHLYYSKHTCFFYFLIKMKYMHVLCFSFSLNNLINMRLIFNATIFYLTSTK